MTDKRNQTPQSEQQIQPTETRTAPGRIDRRGFFRDAAVLTVGGLSATAGLGQSATQRDSGAVAVSADAAEQLAAQTQRAQRWGGSDPADWVRPRDGVDHNVVIVGAGQSGSAIAHG